MKISNKLTLAVLLCGIFLNLFCNKDEKSSNDLAGWFKTGSNEAAYQIGIADTEHNNKPVFYIRSIKDIDSGFGSIAKNFPSGTFREKRVRLTGFIKSNNIYGKAGMWMRVDDANTRKLCFDNMSNRPITGNTDWQKYEIVLDVPTQGSIIYYGVYLSGTGEVLLSDLAFEVVDSDVKSTEIKDLSELFIEK